MNKNAIKTISYSDKHHAVLIRLVQISDAEVIHTAVMNSLKELQPFMDWAHKELSIPKQLERINVAREAASHSTGYDFSVFDKKTNEYLMSASLHAPRVLNKKALSIGYWTVTNHCNKGLGTLLTKILTIIAFDHFHCDRVEIGCNKANQKSLRVIEKCGFKLEGEFQNYFSPATKEMIENGFYPCRIGLLYALTKDDAPTLSWYQSTKDIIHTNH